MADQRLEMVNEWIVTEEALVNDGGATVADNVNVQNLGLPKARTENNYSKKKCARYHAVLYRLYTR